MAVGIGASYPTLTANTTARAADVKAGLDALNNGGISNDGVIATNGGGVMTLVKIAVTTGSIKRIARSTGSATQTITHSWGEQADIVLPYYNGSFGTAPTQALAVKNEGANSFDVVGQTGYSWTVLYIKF